MKRPNLHRILPPLVMSAAAAVPGLSAALIVLHAGSSPVTEISGASSADLAGVSTTSRVSSGSLAASGSTKADSPESQAISSTRRTAAAAPTKTLRIVPTATPAASTVQSAPLQSQSSSTNYVSGATGR